MTDELVGQQLQTIAPRTRAIKAAKLLAESYDTLTINDIQKHLDDPPHADTIRRALRELEDLDIVEQREKNSPYWNSSLATNKANIDIRTDKAEVVVWKRNGETVVHDPVRTPKLGWDELTVLEAKADSAKTALSMGHESTAQESLNDILQILRARIERQKEQTPQGQLLNTCEHRETTRTRCNRYPTDEGDDGGYYCKGHIDEANRAFAGQSKFALDAEGRR